MIIQHSKEYIPFPVTSNNFIQVYEYKTKEIKYESEMKGREIYIKQDKPMLVNSNLITTIKMEIIKDVEFPLIYLGNEYKLNYAKEGKTINTKEVYLITFINNISLYHSILCDIPEKPEEIL